jgi:hypothetical protein
MKNKLWLLTSFLWIFNSLIQGLYSNNIPASMNAFGAAAMIWLLIKDNKKEEK